MDGLERQTTNRMGDALHTLAIFFVIYGHQVFDFTGCFVFTSPIKLALHVFLGDESLTDGIEMYLMRVKK